MQGQLSGQGIGTNELVIWSTTKCEWFCQIEVVNPILTGKGRLVGFGYLKTENRLLRSFPNPFTFANVLLSVNDLFIPLTFSRAYVKSSYLFLLKINTFFFEKYFLLGNRESPLCNFFLNNSYTK